MTLSIKSKIIISTLVALIFLVSRSFAEPTAAEKEVVDFVDYMQEMSYTGEYTEGIPHDDIMKFLEENITNMAKIYKISLDDVNALRDNLKYKKPLPTTYKAPSIPDAKEKEWLRSELKKSLAYYIKKSKHYKESNVTQPGPS
jgi:hypothetical protein